MENTEFSQERSQHLANLINSMKFFLCQVDIKYTEAVAKRFDQDAGTYHSAAVLIKSYDPRKGELLSLQANTLRDIVALIKNLKKCDELKTVIAANEEKMAEVEKLFNF